MEALKQLPIGVQDFESLRNDDYLYIDKTAFVYQLATTGRYYFMSRPRRFGKSMLISTLHAYFEGKKELFDGLAIAELEKDWTKYPVLHLDLNLTDYNTGDSLDKILNDYLTKWEDIYGARESEETFALRFAGIVKRACEQTGKRVVILVDEYDKPILQTIDNAVFQDRYRAILKSFYGVLKTMDRCIRFALLTGVTKFGKVSVFSDLNNMEDISMDEDYAPICGITDEELDTLLIPYIERLSDRLKLPISEVREELRKRYDGYHFMEDSIALYNPFSVLNTLKRKKFGSYWFETGTPTYLVTLLKRHNYTLSEIDGIQVGVDSLNSIDSSSTDPIPVIYQSGYLTIKGYTPRGRIYKLGFPNEEVEDGFMNFLLPYYTSLQKSQTAFFVNNFVDEVLAGDIDGFMNRLKSMYANTPYDLIKDTENYFQNAMYLLCTLAGLQVKAEYKTANGRIDMMIETNDSIYLFEFKFDKTAEEAMAQINEKEYLLPFNLSGKKLVKIGANFSSETRNIERWVVE